MPPRLRVWLFGALIFVLFWGGRRLLRRLRNAEQSLPTERGGVIRKVTHHDNGRMKTERYLLDGVMHGPWMIWDEDGNKLAEGHHKDGMLDGAEIRYGSDGQKLREISWVEGRRHGTTTEHDADGKPAQRLCYVHAEEGTPPAHDGPCAQDELDVPKPD